MQSCYHGTRVPRSPVLRSLRIANEFADFCTDRKFEHWNGARFVAAWPKTVVLPRLAARGAFSTRGTRVAGAHKK